MSVSVKLLSAVGFGLFLENPNEKVSHMTSTVAHQNGFDLRGKRVKLEGLEQSIFVQRSVALNLIDGEAKELGDRIAYHVTSSKASRQAATLDHRESIAAARKVATVSGGIVVASFMAMMIVQNFSQLIKNHFSSPGVGTFASDMAVSLLTTSVIMGCLGLVFALLVVLLSPELIVEATGKRGSDVWGIGDKAIYFVKNGAIQVVRLDAIGAVKMRGTDILSFIPGSESLRLVLSVPYQTLSPKAKSLPTSVHGSPEQHMSCMFFASAVNATVLQRCLSGRLRGL
jgi:hypothetical protein